jgi:hypothetical protein
MFTQLAVPDVVNVNMDLHRPLVNKVISSMSPNVPISSKPLLHSLGYPPISPPYVRFDDSSSLHGSFLEGLPHVRARLDAR